jgi:hypothetical protein
MRPNSQPPTGRIRKPTAKMPAVLSSCAVRSPLGKNAGAKYSEKAEYAYQSYHSTRLPTAPPVMAFRRRPVSAAVSVLGKVGVFSRFIGRPAPDGRRLGGKFPLFIEK